MSLTMGTGPLGGEPGDANYSLDAPAHRLLFEPEPRRLRALVGDRVVLDSRRARLLHETGLLPVVYVPLADLDAAAMERTATSTHCPFKGDASYWSLRIADRVVQDAVWAYEDPIERASWLRGFAALDRRKADAWLVEDDPVTGHVRDPYHRVDVHASSRTVTVTARGEVVARSTRPMLVFETGLAPRAYLPRADVHPGVLEPSDTRTVCPYKGEASYWHVLGGGASHADAAWSYESPRPEAIRAAGHVSFAGDGVDIEIAPAP